MSRYFHFTLGPVQVFVAQARKTRDFKIGSILLSYLAGVAMLEVIKQGGEIVFPKPDDNYLLWIETGKGPQNKPQHGGIPNRFLAEVGNDFSPAKVKQAVKKAWRELAEWVWQGDLQDFVKSFDEKTQKTIRDLWIRQIDGFWDISWAIVEEPKDTSVLDRRKNWRSHYLQPEPGQKCMMMDGMQELSGAEKPGEGKAFWEALRQSKPNLQTDLREGERLCAIAYVKRRFAHYFDRFKADMPTAWQAHGWAVEASAISVVALAAKPWLDNAKAKAEPAVLRQFYNAARVLSGKKESSDEPDWSSIDELAFYEADLRNPKLYPDALHAQADDTLQALAALQKTDGLGNPSPYYALLLMDGDSLGKHMGDADKRELISDALNRFTSQVQTIVEQDGQGFLVYAGGDDVLALLTLDRALPCAAELRAEYTKAFAAAHKAMPDVETFPATISAAIQLAHYRLPFTKILGDAHALLDDVAKDGRGRDAVAVRVWKQSGLHLTWAQPWETAFGKHHDHQGLVWLASEAKKLANDQAGIPVGSGFIYRLRELFTLLQPAKDTAKQGIDEADLLNLLAYQFAHSGLHDNAMQPQQAKQFIEPLLKQCQPQRRTEKSDGQRPQFEIVADTPVRYEADAALLLRFLANHGNER